MIDLRQLAGDRYKITLDECTEVDRDLESRLWYYRIAGRAKGSFVSVHGPNMLACYAEGGVTIDRLMAIPGVCVHQRGDHEVRILFSPELLDTVADVIKARRRRRVSEEARQRLIAQGEAHRFRRRERQRDPS